MTLNHYQWCYYYEKKIIQDDGQAKFRITKNYLKTRYDETQKYIILYSSKEQQNKWPFILVHIPFHPKINKKIWL